MIILNSFILLGWQSFGMVFYQQSQLTFQSLYTNNYNQSYSCYLLTKKDCDMTANKLTGDKGILFTATYVTTFERAKEENKQLVQDNTKLQYQMTNKKKESIKPT